MTTAIQTPVIDRDRRRACRLAHLFGAATAGVLALLVTTVGLFRAHPLPVLLAIGPVLAVAAGLAADLMARPQPVRFGDGWLAISRFGHWHRVLTSQLTGLSANPHVAASVVLRDAAGNEAEVDTRCLIRNPLIWTRFQQDVSQARRSGSLRLTEEDYLFWQSLVRQAAAADSRLLAALDFDSAA